MQKPHRVSSTCQNIDRVINGHCGFNVLFERMSSGCNGDSFPGSVNVRHSSLKRGRRRCEIKSELRTV